MASGQAGFFLTLWNENTPHQEVCKFPDFSIQAFPQHAGALQKIFPCLFPQKQHVFLIITCIWVKITWLQTPLCRKQPDQVVLSR